ncbi:glucosidase 2 subunit beta-like [Uloborus diversus]|uniref:glucosidase 2 subunit beta-like n=1 Tax=Uloborus diversus TaxID=327109 RepID=UPI00240A1088|nr:glucosidase 2 subunit beta-like [Uloborus diversus]
MHQDGKRVAGKRTSACELAVFHCINSGHISINIPSSRVNDNICDCCDGSDEYNSTADCVNTCLELGRQAREEEQKLQELYEQGFALRQQYAVQGKQIEENNKVQLENLKKVEIEEEKNKAEKEAIKNEAEDKEKAALSAYNSAKEEQRKKQEELEMIQHQEMERKLAETAFHELDLNQDGLLSYDELQKFPKFDSNHDGIVSEDEAKFFLHMKDFLLLDEFITTGWMIMKPIYLSENEAAGDASTSEGTEEETLGQPEMEPEANVGQEESDDETYNPDEENPEEEDLIDDEVETPPSFPPKDTTEDVKSEESEYDEETRQLVDAARDARQKFKESVDALDKIKDEIRKLQTDLDSDFGKDREFAALKGQCFDFDDREYTYRFCPFDKASQISKSGGSDVSLGRWGSWVGPEENRYSKMRYDNGQTCWNGPARSVVVLLHCGLENKLLSSSEPNRCEYLFEFSTPAMCALHENVSQTEHQHTEL